ncbi:MAG TPA: vitamin K epoxide reductase family protein [Kofleriaceae bacterium]|nr:vitamin K epoxide reductase family protein [Kofleriaceae bacterium]
MRRPPPWLAVVLIGAIVGVVFAAISTYDFVQHLDRQVHSLHCSFIPGVSHAGESGCQVAMMSPYSSVLRSRVWGGVPIALPAMSVFAFLVFFVLDLALTRRKGDPRATGFLALASALPAATSAVMLAISVTQLGTTCKLCVCIYVASAICLIGSLAQWRQAVRCRAGADEDTGRGAARVGDEPAFTARGRAERAGRPASEAPGGYDGPDGPDGYGGSVRGRSKTGSAARLVAVDSRGASTGFLAAAVAIGVAFVAVPVALYLTMAPDHARFIGTCEGLSHAEDSYGVMLRVDRSPPGGVPAIEVLDPLCPACRAFEQRLAASGLAGQLDRKAVLFPLDNACNWMVTEATHPGACTVSEAVLCAGDKAPEVIAWAFEVQDRIRSETKADPAAAARIVKQRFPELASCVGSAEARSRLNKSLRWIVANNIHVLTPQLFIDKVKLCDEDVDLGLEYTLSTMLARRAHGGLATAPLEKPLPGAPAAPDGARAPATGLGTPAGKPPAAPAEPAAKPATDRPAPSSERAAPAPGAPSQAGGTEGAPGRAAERAPTGAAGTPDRGVPAEGDVVDKTAPIAPGEPAPSPGGAAPAGSAARGKDAARRGAIDLPSAEQPDHRPEGQP